MYGLFRPFLTWEAVYWEKDLKRRVLGNGERFHPNILMIGYEPEALASLDQMRLKKPRKPSVPWAAPKVVWPAG